MKRTLSILLALTMLLALMTACGSVAPAPSGETAQVEEASSAPAEEAQAQAPAEAEAAAPAEAEEAASAEEPAEPEIPAREPVEYPICDPDEIEFSIFTSAGGMGVSIETLDQFPAFLIAHEKTGVKTTYQLAAPEATEVKINLMIASGDYSTFFTGLDMYYTSGRSAAIADGVVVDLAPYLDECAPDYMNLVDANPGMLKLISTDDGEIPFVAPKAADNYSGLSIRKDWMDALNLEIPETYDQLTEVLEAFKNTYACSDAMLLSSKLCGDHGFLCAGYGMNMLRGNVGSLAFEAPDGKVELFVQSEGFVDYMKMLADWKAKGLIENYYQVAPFNANNYIGADACGVWVSGNSVFGDSWIASYYNGQYDFEAIPIPDVTRTPGEAVEIGGLETTIDGEHAWSVTTSCEDVEAAVKWLNWWYTEEGSMAANFGNEGEHYTMVDGTPVFTDTILNDTSGYGVMFAIASKIGNSTPASQHPARRDPRNTLENEVQQSAKDIWYPESRGTAWTCYGDMTQEESEIYAAKAGDIGTYMEEYMGKVVDGTVDIEDTYEEFLDNCYAMGLQDVLDVKQAAYDRYMAR